MNANIGKLNNGQCYVFLNGDNEPAVYGTEQELEVLIEKHGVVDPIPVFENGQDLTDYPKADKYVAATKEVKKTSSKVVKNKTMQTFRYVLSSKDWYSDQYGVIDAYNKTEARKLIAEAYRQDVSRNAKACGFVPWGDVKIVWEDEE